MEREFCTLFVSHYVQYLLCNVAAAMSETFQKFAIGLTSFTHKLQKVLRSNVTSIFSSNRVSHL
jgi:hypothetical protein